MATSGTTAWSLTARDMISQALKKSRVISAGEEPEASELEDCLIEFNGLLKSWGAKANLWREASATATIAANDPSVELPVGVQDIMTARLVVSATHDRQLAKWEREDYQNLPNKTARGLPTIFYLSQGVGAPTLYVWPVPTANATIAYDYQRLPETITDASETVDFPQEYQEALYTNLALNCWGLFQDGDPPASLYARAQRLESEMLDASRPGSYFMRADCA